MTKEELRDSYPGDVLKVEIDNWLKIPEAVIIRLDDIDRDGLPDKAYVVGERFGGGSVLISVKPESCTFIRHNSKVQELLDNQGWQKNTIDKQQVIDMLNDEGTAIFNDFQSIRKKIEDA